MLWLVCSSHLFQVAISIFQFGLKHFKWLRSSNRPPKLYDGDEGDDDEDCDDDSDGDDGDDDEDGAVDLQGGEEPEPIPQLPNWTHYFSSRSLNEVAMISFDKCL